MFRQAIRSVALAIAVATAGWAAPVAAQEAGAGAVGKTDNTHPNSRKVNQGNTRVIHAGPGTPAAGAVFVPPAQEKRDGKR
jgi:hypothetical protein